MMKATKTWIFIVLLIIPAIHVHAYPIPDTGQTKCYNNNSTGEIPCPAPGEAFYGQDAHYSIDPPSYTKLDASGNTLPDAAAEWAMVRDNVTGLIWENKTSDGTIHDSSKRFTWCDTNPTTNGGDQGTCGTGTGDGATDTEAFIKALNDKRFGGFSDWRMPNVQELESILNMGNSASSTAWFPGTVSSRFWSSNTWAGGTYRAWYVDFNSPYLYADWYYGEKSGAYLSAQCVRAVRGGQSRSLNHLVNNGDGTVTDSATGLMWQREKPAATMTWEAALIYAEGLSLAGYDDWRLPTLKELASIVDYSHYSPAIDTAIFPGTLSSYTNWSSNTSLTWGNHFAWCVDFGGGDDNNICGKTSAYAVRAVRGGQSRVSGHLVIFEPSTAARWNIGEQKTITWDPAGITGNVKISLSRQGGKSGTFTETIAEGVPNSGSYTWVVTGPETFSAALRIEPLSDPSKGATQSLFTMASPLSAWITAEKLSDTGQYKLTLNGQYADGAWFLEPAFISSDVSIATIDQYGFLTALKNGYVEFSSTYLGQICKKGLFVYTTFDTSETETNNAKAEADEMTEGRFYRGRFSDGTDVDYFKFTLANPSLIQVGYLSYRSTADVKVELFNAADILFASRTSGNGQPLTFPLGLPAGDYYLKLSSAGDVDQTNYYVIAFKTIGSLPVHTPVPIALGESKTGTLNHLTDQTDFTFTLARDQGIQLVFTTNSDVARYRIALMDSAQTILDQRDYLEHKPLILEAFYGAGSYTLRVTPIGDIDAVSPFTVQLANSAKQLEQEPNDTYQTATEWDSARSITGRLPSNTDTDFYRFDLSTPRYLELAFASPGSSRNFSLTLYKDSDANEIDGLDVLDGREASSFHMGLGMGRYYLRVRENGTAVDTVPPYTLTMRDSPQTNLEIESNNTLKVANAIENGIAKKGRIYTQTDKDYFGFHLPTEDLVSVTFTPSTTTGDYKISLRNENDIWLESYTSSNGQPQSLEFYQTPGNYYLRVEPNGDIDQYKTYDLTITSNAAITGIKQLVSVTVTGSQSEMQPPGTQILTANAGYSDASATTVTPLWTSLNPVIASADGAGLVTARTEGTTSIVAAFGGLTGKFDLTVGAPRHVVKQHYGNLILVAGGGIADTNTLKESTQYLSDLVYRRFKSRLFTDADIYYFNPMPWHDLDGDGYGESVVDDSTPTVFKFGQAITTWAASQDTDGPLYVYLIDHGGIDNFMLFPGEIVTADQLKGFLDAFQTATLRKVVVVIEACKSGSFTDNIITQGQNRVVVTSTDDKDAYIQLGGRISFSQFFVDRLLTGDSLYQGYIKAKQQLANMGLPYSNMQPKLVEGVNLSSNTTRLGGDFAIASLFPEITETSSEMNILANTTQNFYAKLSSLEGIEAVWAVVVPPDYIPPDPSQNLQAPTVNLPTLTLTDPEKDKRYEGTYNNFIYNGDYWITFYARNANGNVSVSPSIRVTATGGQNTASTLTITKSGTGDGTVTSDLAGIACGTDCSETYSTAATLTLTAAPDNKSDFAGWFGTGIACPGTGSCTVLVDSAKLVNAYFTRKLLKGDINDDGAVNLADAILALKVLAGISPSSGVLGGIRADYATSGVDVNGDKKISLAEVIYIIQMVTGMR